MLLPLLVDEHSRLSEQVQLFVSPPSLLCCFYHPWNRLPIYRFPFVPVSKFRCLDKIGEEILLADKPSLQQPHLSSLPRFQLSWLDRSPSLRFHLWVPYSTICLIDQVAMR